MTSELDIHPDVLAIAVALASNPEAFRQATELREHECTIKTDPGEKLIEWSLAIARGLDAGQRSIKKRVMS